MFRSPLSFFGAAVPLPPALAPGAVVAPPLVPWLPMHAAAIGIAAAAAAPLRSVRRSIFRWVPSSTLMPPVPEFRPIMRWLPNGAIGVSRCAKGRLGAARLRLLGIEPEVGDRLGDVRRRVLLVEREAVQRRDRDALGVHLEELAERLPRVGTAEAVGPERDAGLRGPA